MSKEFLYGEFKKWNNRAVLAEASLRTRDHQMKQAVDLLADTELCTHEFCLDSKCQKYREFLISIGTK